MTSLVVSACGPMTSLQDTGRFGAQRHGVSRSGAMDRLALAVANALAGNPPGTAAIELMLLGGRFTVADGRVRVGVAGAPVALAVDGQPVPAGRSFTLEEGQVLSAGTASAGIFAYLAVGGGFDLPAELGSLSLQARAGIGGLQGRALRAGDRLPLAGTVEGPEVRLDLAPIDRASPIRVVLGPQDDYFDAAAQDTFLSDAFEVSAEADRMGYRLAGPAIGHHRGFNIVSDGIVSGSVQVPGNGLPIVLMADGQPTGGYPKIATVISADLRILAQRRAGEAVRFRSVTMAEAQEAARERAALMAGLFKAARPVDGGLPGVEELLALNLAGAATDALAAEP